MIDTNKADEPFASIYKATMSSHEGLDAAGIVLFCDTTMSLTVHATRAAALDSSAAREIRQKVRTLHDGAMKYDPEVMRHDSLDFQSPTVLQSGAVPDVVTVNYPITLRLRSAGSSQGDDRASGFAIYSAAEHRVLYATFGHPEWDPAARTVNAVYPKLLFSVAGDPHVYLLAAYLWAWESGRGGWVIFDAQSGLPITAPELQE